MIRHFCDRCDQQLIEPDEKIDFVTGKPTDADVCWQCRLQELVDMYNQKTSGTTMNSRAAAILHWSPPMRIREATLPMGGFITPNTIVAISNGGVLDAES